MLPEEKTMSSHDASVVRSDRMRQTDRAKGVVGGPATQRLIDCYLDQKNEKQQGLNLLASFGSWADGQIPLIIQFLQDKTKQNTITPEEELFLNDLLFAEKERNKILNAGYWQVLKEMFHESVGALKEKPIVMKTRNLIGGVFPKFSKNGAESEATV